MFEFPKLRSLFLVAALIIFGASRSSASPVPIQDNGAFFSDSAKSEASRNISELEKSVKKGVVVQTFKELPADVKQGLNLEDKAAVKSAIAQWALKQFKQSGVNGVYILLVKSPAHLQVEVGNDTQTRAFTLRDRDALVSAMLVRLHAKQYDDALLEGVNFVSSTMRANAPRGGRTNFTTQNGPGGGANTTLFGSTRPQQHSSGWLIPLLIGAVVVWIIISIIRSIFRGSGGGVAPGGMMSPMGGGYGGGGGGFFSSLIGGVFGAAAGNWIYDQFSGNRGNSSFGSDRDNNQSNQNTGDQGYTGTDTDATGSGGSFGDDSGGGGDSGGGDSGGGGGDSGGGDSGGGGGDF
jgi:uncharacterized membrane protein YeaQ/YmgE (transglycosylase-associated protein family)